MHNLHAYYGQCVFYRYELHKLLLNIYFVTGYLMIALYKYIFTRKPVPEKFVYRRTRKFTNVGQVGEGGGGEKKKDINRHSVDKENEIILHLLYISKAMYVAWVILHREMICRIPKKRKKERKGIRIISKGIA